jgi:regulator of RNase E activity RraA
MNNEAVRAAFAALSTAAVADACLRAGADLRLVPGMIRPLIPGSRLAGRARPVRHAGSVDVFFEALNEAAAGDVLVVDNGGRTDEGCLGDLVALEVMGAGLAGIVIWGCHRDTRGLLAVDLPIFSVGQCPVGPRRRTASAPARARAVHIGVPTVSPRDMIFADDDGVIVVATDDLDAVLPTAAEIQRAEQRQAEDVAFGRTLREQLRFPDYLAARQRDSAHTFREHLRRIGGTIEV